MKVRVYVNDRQLGAVFRRISTVYPAKGRAAMRMAANEVAQEIESEGRADIAGAGRFGSRWTDGFHATVTEGGGNIKIDVTEDVPYWTVFEYGATISGKPLLWIPLDDEQRGVRARDYPGRLFRVDRVGPQGEGAPMMWRGHSSKGPRSEPILHPPHSMSDVAPLLLDWDTKQPKYFGKTSVTIPQKFHLRPIARAAAARLPLLWKARMKDAKNG